MGTAYGGAPILLNLDEQSWNEKVDRAATWFGSTLMLQTAFRELAASTRDKVEEPHIRSYLGDIHDRAVVHERQAEELFALIGRDLPRGRTVAGTLVAGTHKLLGKVEGTASGATDAWLDLRQLLLTNLDAMGAFAVAEQLGFALAMPDVSAITFEIENEKRKHQLIIQELLLETAAVAILYQKTI